MWWAFCVNRFIVKLLSIISRVHHLALKSSFRMKEFNFLLKFVLSPVSDQRFVGILFLSLLSSFLKSNFLYGPRISLPLYTKQDVKKKFYLDKISSSNKATFGGRIKHIASVWRNGNGASRGILASAIPRWDLLLLDLRMQKFNWFFVLLHATVLLWSLFLFFSVLMSCCGTRNFIFENFGAVGEGS